MAKKDKDKSDNHSVEVVANKNVHDLTATMQAVKNAQAERDDVVVELHQSKLTKLEMLAKDLQPVFEQVPVESDPFEFALSHGQTPRLWIDATTHIRMSEDRRLFELIKDTRNGRTILYSTKDQVEIGKVTTDYVADRLLERERMIEGEWTAMRGYSFLPPDVDETELPATEDEAHAAKTSKSRPWLWFVFGVLSAVALLFAWAWFGEIPTTLQ